MDNELAVRQEMIAQIRDIMNNARKNIATHVNNEQLIAYWNIGRVTVEHEQDNEKRAEYGKATLKQISRQLTKEFGRGFSVSNLQYWIINDNEENIFGKLDSDEIDLLFETGVATQNIRRSVGLI